MSSTPQIVKPYTYFSKIYSHLMSSVDYKYWAKYLIEIHDTIGSKKDIALELAAGNCEISSYLKNQFARLYVSDLSFEMLKNNKKCKNKICCNMIHLPFKNEFDFIYSTFDSINYLNDETKLSLFFNNISNQLSENGYLVFDVSLKHNSLKHLKKLNRKGKYKNISFEQISKFDEETLIHSNLIRIKLKDGSWVEELHKQKIYDFYYYFDVIESNDLYVSECFDAFDFKDGNRYSDRVQFIVKRKN
ncbi:MAG: methyltransferase domain-containing protein [Ignavibacteriales bacterium]|nr:methyltransferase domain-containing protein [Ignavibacteriales bacterium]